jgi:hypothetical protein
MDHEGNLELEGRNIGHQVTTTKDGNEVGDTGDDNYNKMMIIMMMMMMMTMSIKRVFKNLHHTSTPSPGFRKAYLHWL